MTRYYKDGIGSAYRSAKAAAVTAVFQGISAADFDRHYGPVCRGLKYDNIIAKLMFAVIRQIQRWRFGRRAILRMLTREQQSETGPRHLSSVMWDMYTGSSPYREILLRTLHPAFLGRLVSDMVLSMATRA